MSTDNTSDKLTSINALIIEDCDDDCLLLVNHLDQGGYHVQFRQVYTLEALRDALKDQWDIIFSDYSMPTMTGIDALIEVRRQNQEIPFIFVSGTIGEDVAVDAMRNGAQDYIMKDNLKRLLPAVSRELHDYQTRKEHREAEQRLYRMSRYDNLTSLPNRFHFMEQLNAAIEEHAVENGMLALIYIDIDRFKSINDSLGFEAGNLLLKEVSSRLDSCVEKGVVSRLATDEFALLIPCHSRQQVSAFLERVFASLEKSYTIYDLSLYFSASIGVSIFPDDTDNATELLGNADIATHKIKGDGGNGFLFYTPSMSVQLEERLAIEHNMRTGLENNEFFLNYQPQVELSTGRIVGTEALLRWKNSQMGLINPGDFIPLAEETGFILPLGNWVLNDACQQLREWHTSLNTPIRVAVNVSAMQFHDGNLVDRIKQLLKDYQLIPELLEIEITESAIIRDIEAAVRTLKKIQRLGIKVALDDFGTGYSSLSYLKSFKTDYLKIDQSFIREITHDNEDQAIVRAIIAMANELSIKTIAEGVETLEQYEFLRTHGCDIIQGYYISRPIDANRIYSLLQSHRREQLDPSDKEYGNTGRNII